LNTKQDKIAEFMKKINQNVRTKPTTNIPYREKMLRIKLIIGEVSELIDAMSNDNLIEIADGLGDILYVIYGTCNTYGIHIEDIFDEIHRSNLTKSVEDGGEDSSGKVLKGPNYSPPDIKSLIDKQIKDNEIIC